MGSRKFSHGEQLDSCPYAECNAGVCCHDSDRTDVVVVVVISNLFRSSDDVSLVTEVL